MSYLAPLARLAALLLTCLLTPSESLAKGLDSLRLEAREWLLDQARQAYPSAQAQVDIGPLDPRLHLAPCSQVRFFLPAGAKLWRPGTLGVKCVGPASWNIYLSYQARLTGPALVSKHALPARHLLSQEDVALVPVPYQQDPGSYPLTLPDGAVNQRPMAAGQAVLIQDLALPDVIRAGSQVRVRAIGAGFSVSQEGKALNAAKAGGEVRVKMPTGRIVRGLATPAGEVEINP